MRVGSTVYCLALVVLPGCPSRPVPRDSGFTTSAARPPHLGLVPSFNVRPDAGSVAAVTISDRPAPASVLGVHWGMSRADVMRLAQVAGVTCHDSAEYLFCPRALVTVATPAVASYEFCDDGLCSVALDTESTRDEGRLQADFAALRAAMERELGPPAADTHRVAAGCTGHLALCLTSRQAVLRARWSWTDGSQAMVSADQDETDAFKAAVSATYLSPARARRSDPEPDPLDVHTDAGAPPR